MESESGHSPEGGRPPKAPRTGSRPGSPSGVDAPEATAALAYQQYGLHPSELSAHRQDTEKGVGGVDAQEGLRRQLALRAAKDAEEDRLKLAETQPLNLLSAALSAAPGYDAEILAAANSARMDSDTTAPLNADANARARSTFRALLTVSRTDEATFQAAHNSLYKIAGDECISCVVPSSANESPLILSLARSDDHRDWQLLLKLKARGSELFPSEEAAFDLAAGFGAYGMLCQLAAARENSDSFAGLSLEPEGASASDTAPNVD
mmetsp:Transcript_6526/g.19346  ORF Transcript_6526/g.19346 Transcript_6526/m.19346 type:complete len:265 (+) Transcript_6526:2-796(+)